MSAYLQLLAEGKLDEAEEARKLEVPDKLYKFVWLGNDEAENGKRFLTLRNRQIWISPIDALNDPYEFRTIRVDEEKLIAAHYPKDLIQAFKDMLYEDLLWLGVSSLSEDGNKSMPMWAYYSNNQQGFCVEYEVDDPQCIYKVSYENERVSVALLLAEYFSEFRKLQDKTGKQGEFNQHTVDQIIRILRGQLHMKHCSWSHEKEYRIIFPLQKDNETGQFQGWNADLDKVGLRTSRIIVGLNCQDKHLEKLNTISNELDLGNAYKQELSETMFWEEKQIK